MERIGKAKTNLKARTNEETRYSPYGGLRYLSNKKCRSLKHFTSALNNLIWRIMMIDDMDPELFKQKVAEIYKQFEPVGMVHKDQYGYGASLVTGMEHGTKLYTHPKLLKSLTNDEIQEACKKSDKDFNIASFTQGALWAEQKLKEKNK